MFLRRTTIAIVLATVSATATTCFADLVDLVQLDNTEHINRAGRDFLDGFDGDFDTSHKNNDNGVDGGGGAFTGAEHLFKHPHDVEEWTYRLRAHSAATGENNRQHSGFFQLEYTINGSDWIIIDETRQSFSKGDGDTTIDSGMQTLEKFIPDVKGVRGTASASATASGGEGSWTADSNVYEAQAYAAIPEPSMVAALSVGLIGVAGRRYWNRRRAARRNVTA